MTLIKHDYQFRAIDVVEFEFKHRLKQQEQELQELVGMLIHIRGN